MYVKTVWQEGVTPLGPANLNKLETQYDEAVAAASPVSGTFLETTSIAAGQGYTKRIPLGRAGAWGRMTMHGVGSKTGAVIIRFDTVEANTVALMAAYSGTTVWAEGVRDSGRVFGNQQGCMIFDSGNYIALLSCYIDGTDLLIKWQNYGGSAVALSNTFGAWEVF